MSTELALIEEENRLVKALQVSVYVDNSEEGIKLVIDYCKRLELDPLTKPVHLVKIDGKEIIMPGIGLFRIRAHRSGQYVGLSEPEFGPTITERVGKTEMSYPEWCKITIKKLINGQIAEFSTKEIWRECYGTVNDKVSPNVFWYKRPFAQLAKTAESQVLRKAFPDLVSHGPTYEESHTFTKEPEKDITPAVPQVEMAVEKTADAIKAKLEYNAPFEGVDTSTGEVVVEATPEDSHKQWLIELKTLIQKYGIPEETYNEWKSTRNVRSFSELNLADLKEVVEMVQNGWSK